MPIYTFVNDKTNETFEEMMTIAEMESFLEENKHIRQVITKVNITDPMSLGVTRPPSDFQKHVLGKIKKGHPKGSVEKRWTIPKEI